MQPNRNLTKEQAIVKFFGDIKRWPVEPDGHNFTQSQIEAIGEHIAKTGDCLWHAETVVMGWLVCHCAKCMKVGGAVVMSDQQTEAMLQDAERLARISMRERVL